MTKVRKKTSLNTITDSNNLHTSIQFSLDGFSFCIHQNKNLVHKTSYIFGESCSSPQELLTQAKQIFEEDTYLHYNFESITVVHRNNLNTLVPNSHFNENNLKNYLQYNVKIFASDYFAFDDLDVMKAKNVYVPFVNINNYLLDNFGDFHYYHHHSLLVKKLIEHHAKNSKQVFAYFEHKLLDIVVLDHQDVLLVNSFEISNPEDFIYYILFVYEQLQLDNLKTPLIIGGETQKESKEFTLAYTYIKNVALLDSKNPSLQDDEFQNSELFLLA